MWTPRSKANEKSKIPLHDTQPEMKIRQILHHEGINFITQHPHRSPVGSIKHPEGTYFLFDFWLPEHKTVIRVNGVKWHDQDRDEETATMLVKEGITVIDITDKILSTERGILRTKFVLKKLLPEILKQKKPEAHNLDIH